MKRQYLGDSKDSFKWDYLDYLTAGLNYPLLNVLLMLTPDDNGNHGNTRPELFPARQQVLHLCRFLRDQRDFKLIKTLPKSTGSKYLVELHKEETYFTSINRQEYMSDISHEKRQVLFLDPDNGFEPETRHNEKHVLYTDVNRLLDQLSPDAVILVFQHFRRILFDNDFRRIKERLQENNYATAIYWRHFLMFIAITKTKAMIDKIVSINQRYSQNKPLKILK